MGVFTSYESFCLVNLGFLGERELYLGCKFCARFQGFLFLLSFSISLPFFSFSDASTSWEVHFSFLEEGYRISIPELSGRLY